MAPSAYAPLQDGDTTLHNDESQIELSSVVVASPRERGQHRPRLSELFMPAKLHRALRYRESSDSDSSDDDDDNDEKASFDGNDAASAAAEDDIEALLKRKSREGKAPRGSRHADEEAAAGVQQPAWARRGSDETAGHSTENNVLKRTLVLPTVFLLVVVVLAAFFTGSQKLSTKANVYLGAKSKLTFDSVFDGTFRVEHRDINWLAEAGDGVYSYRLHDNSIMLHDLATNSSRELVRGSAVLNSEGLQLDYQTFSVSHDMRYILFGAAREQVWRHSSRSNFWIHDLLAHTTAPLLEPTFPARTAFATWAPQGHSIAYVHQNDLYVSVPGSGSGDGHGDGVRGEAIRVTSTGNETVFNGIPDWVYEEEVFAADSATWWAPDGRKLVFLSFDESDVRVYSFPIYNKNRFAPGAARYPENYEMRYPKPGTPNPRVRMYSFDLDVYHATNDTAQATQELLFADPMDITDRVVTEVAWVGTNDLIVKETDRAASRERAAHFDFAENTASKTREGVVTRDTDWVKLDGGWAETGQYVHGIDAFPASSSSADGALPQGYLDIVPDSSGYSHIAMFSPANEKEPLFLTSGEWEIDGGVQAVDVERKLIYFIASNPSTQRHLYSIPLPSPADVTALKNRKQPPAPTPLTNTSETGFYSTSFSPQAGFYLLNQRAGLPWQRLEKVDDREGTFEFPITHNRMLNETLAMYRVPKTTYHEVQVNNVSVHVAVISPPHLDTSGQTQYPLILRPYGGPNSQTVQERFKLDYSHFLASEYGYIVLEVDGRGTGFRGRAFKTVIRGQLGKAEIEDQLAVAKLWGELPYVDEKRIGFQGWSYGGFLASKIIEANSSIIAAAVAVAPVTSFVFYDSIYTERYMGTLESNRAGYESSAVTKMEGFRHADFLLMHGSGDDNVHFANSAALLDRLTYAGINRFRFRMFTDSAHNMGVRNAYTAVFKTMTDFLVEKLGKAERVKGTHDTK